MPGAGSVLTGVVHTSSPTSGAGPLRGPAMSMDPAQSVESSLSNSLTGRCGVVSRATAFRGELKRAKSQGWSSLSGDPARHLRLRRHRRYHPPQSY